MPTTTISLPEGEDVRSTIERLTGTEVGEPLSGAAFTALFEVVRDEYQAQAMAGTMFWANFLAGDLLPKHAASVGLVDDDFARGKNVFVVPTGPIENPRLDLLVAYTRRSRDDEPRSAPIEVSAGDMVDAWVQWLPTQRRRLWAPARERRAAALREACSPQMLVDMLDRKPLHIIFAPIAEPVFTCVPTPHWEMAGEQTSIACSTAGVLARGSGGAIGVTAALHAFPNLQRGDQIVAAGRRATVRSIDSVSDSCFAVFDDAIPRRFPRGRRGPLSGVSPRMNEELWFDGVTAGERTAVVTGWSPDIPFVAPYSQLKVLTNACTSLKDSGAALVDNHDRVVGFSFYRTGIGSRVEFSAWIWADSVYAAHGLKPL